MNIKFKDVKLKNFMSFSDVCIDLNNRSYTLVSGINNDINDLAKSNGSGKSSLWEAIIWNLTGDTIRGTKNVVNQEINKGCLVELNFILDNNEYKIIRYKEDPDYGTNLKIYINGEDKSGKGIRDTEKLLGEYLPDLNASLLGSVIILGQGLPQRFTNNTPSGRKEVLEKLAKSDFMIQDIKDKLTQRKIDLSNILRKYDDTILSDQSKLSIYYKQEEDTKKELEELNQKDFENEINTLIKNINDSKVQIDDETKIIEEYKIFIDTTQKEIDLIDNKIESKKLEINSKYNEELNMLVKDSYKISIEKDNLEKQIKDYKSIKDICPTCGQKLPNVEIIDTTSLEEELQKTIISFNNIIKKIDSLKEQINKEIENYEILINKDKEEFRKKLISYKEKYFKDSQQLDFFVREWSSKEKELQKVQLQKEQHVETLTRLNNSIKSIKCSINQLNEELLYNNKERDNYKLRQDVVNKMLTIATRDFRGYLLSEVIKFINNKAKEYCKEIFDTEEIEFKLDGNNIYIGYHNKPYENLSGGEKQKIDLIIQFSIRDMLSQFLNFSSNILVLDEIFDNLDTYGCERVLNLITNKLIDIESIFIITHHSEELSIPYDNEILVIKDKNGISRIE